MKQAIYEAIGLFIILVIGGALLGKITYDIGFDAAMDAHPACIGEGPHD